MAAETTKVTRDGTMEVTAKEGMAYLEKEKPDLANQIKQQLKDDQAEKPANGSGDAPAADSNGTTKVTRDNTMVQTAEEGLEFLRRQAGGEDVIKGHGLDKLIPDALPEEKTPKIPQDRTMVETAKEGKQFLEKEGGVNEDAKTRSQEKELNDSKSEDKEATKRSADEQTEEADEAKKQKVEESNGEEKAEEAPAQAEAKE